MSSLNPRIISWLAGFFLALPLVLIANKLKFSFIEYIISFFSFVIGLTLFVLLLIAESTALLL